MTTSRAIARNSALNLIGQALPIAVAIVAIPPLVRGLGPERFGVLTLAWAAIGYFSLFELGVSRALTQAVAQRLGNGGEEDLPALTWSALLMLFAFGTVGGIVLAAVSPLLVTRVLNVPDSLRVETVRAFWILAASLPLVVTSVGLRGVMEAHQHFGIATALRVPLVVFMFLGPLLLLPFSTSLVPAVFILVIGRALGFVAHLVFCVYAYPFLHTRIRFERGPVGALLRFGGWTTVSNVVSPMMVFLDRFVVGALLPLAAVAHYVTPYEAVTKLLVVPIALLGAMLPAFASTVTTNPERMSQLYERSLRGVVLVMFPIVLVAVAFAREGLLLWVGPVLPPESTFVLQWLAVGVLINGLAQPPLTALQSAARPDVIAKLHVAELPLYAIGLFVLVKAFGLQGVAIAWTLRVAADAVALLWIAHRKLGVPVVPELGRSWALLSMLGALAVAALIDTTRGRVLYVVVVLVLFSVAAWRLLLTGVEREGLYEWLKRPMMAPDAQPETFT